MNECVSEKINFFFFQWIISFFLYLTYKSRYLENISFEPAFNEKVMLEVLVV